VNQSATMTDKNIKLGQRVVIRGKVDDFGPGTVRFVGPTKINAGIWVGIELDKPCTWILIVFLVFSCDGRLIIAPPLACFSKHNNVSVFHRNLAFGKPASVLASYR
jgi:hypothetical protein